jgi:hypothetical protein
MSVIPGPAKVVVTSSRHQIVCGLTQRAMLAGRLDLFPCLLREDLGPPAITEQKAHGNCDGDSVNTMGVASSDSVSRGIRMARQVLLPSELRQRRDRSISTSRNLSRNCASVPCVPGEQEHVTYTKSRLLPRLGTTGQ